MTSFGTAVLADGLRKEVRGGRLTTDQAVAMLAAVHEHDHDRVTLWCALGRLFALVARLAQRMSASEGGGMMCRAHAVRLFLSLVVQPVTMRPARATLERMKTCEACIHA